MSNVILYLSFLLGWLVNCEEMTKSSFELDDTIQDMVWCGKQNEVVLLRTTTSFVYRSEDYGNTFNLLTQAMDDKEKAKNQDDEKIVDDKEIKEVTLIVKSEADNSTVLFIGSKGTIWGSTNCGKEIEILNKNFNIAQIRLHPTNPSWILATVTEDCRDDEYNICFFDTHALYLTQNFGYTWQPIADNVKQFEWNLIDEKNEVPDTRIYAIIKTQRNDVFVRTDDYFKRIKTLVVNCLEFKIRNGYVFAIQGVIGDEVELLVNTLDNEFEKFHKAQFPDIKLKMKNVFILDSSEGAVFVFATLKVGSPYGRLYISDSTGVRYRLVLKYCLRNTKRGADFAKLQGLEGIYIANVIDDKAVMEYEQIIAKEDPQDGEYNSEGYKGIKYRSSYKNKDTLSLLHNNIKTLITFNKGGSWRSLSAPTVDTEGLSINCKGDCSLNLFLYEDTTIPIITQRHSYGLILAMGNIEKRRSNDKHNVYLSRDGGLTWFEIAKGLHMYEIIDHGGLIVMSSKQESGVILYSWNQGITWERTVIAEKSAVIDEVYIGPDSAALSFFVHAVDESLRRIKLYTVDFSGVSKRQCVGADRPYDANSDFEYWSPYDGRQEQDCILGRKITYVRRKRDSECYTGTEYNLNKSIENCKCTEEDYECDFGFIRRSSNSPCTATISINYNAPEDCVPGKYYTVTKGYRKIVGDSCEDGVNHDPDTIPCPSSALFNDSVATILILLALIFAFTSLYCLIKNWKVIKKKLKKTSHSNTAVKYMKGSYKNVREKDDEDRIVLELK